MLPRPEALARVRGAIRRAPVVALVGPRQCGKTTLARQIVASGSANYFDLEDPVSLARLAEPLTALRTLKGVIVIDEVQRRPDLFPVLRVLADRSPLPSRFLLLGSASPELLRQSSETLAGRLEVLELSGFDLQEVGEGRLGHLWQRGGFPRSYLARSQTDSFEWRRQFIRTFLERDLPQMGITIPAATILRFWTMLAHYHGQVWNAADPARSLGVSEPTTRRYLDLLCGFFMARQLPPWHENLGKRQIKAPKVYVRDSGLLHNLLGIGSERDLLGHPKQGASWEGFAIEQVLESLRPQEAYFWGTHGGAELDLLAIKDGRKIGIEIKRTDAPALTPSMRVALSDLRLEQLVVLYPGSEAYSLGGGVSVVPLAHLAARGGTWIPRRRR
jgi:predicted AAA+ superfamily ATPase